MTPTQTKGTAAGNAAKNRIAEFRENINNGATAQEARRNVRQVQAGPTPVTTPTPTRAGNIQPTVSANQLTNPTPQVNPPAPQQPTVPARVGQFVSNVARDTQGFITAQTEEAKQAKDMMMQYGALAEDTSFADMMKEERKNLGIDDNLAELKDIQLQLTDMNTQSDLTKTRVEGAAGQTMNQASREVTQEDRENAVRSSGLAARAAVLQGNINTATQLAKDTVDLAYKDRTVQLQSLIQQSQYYQGLADDQTAQLLADDQRQYEAELSRLNEVKTTVAAAFTNGATQAEIGQLSASSEPPRPGESQQAYQARVQADDAAKLALAQSIVARGQTQMRNLQIEAQRANIAQSYAAAAASNRSNRSPASVAAEIPTFEEFLNAKQEQAGMTLDAKARAEAETEYNGLKKQAITATMTPLAQAIAATPNQYFELSATDKAEVLPQLTAAGIKLPKNLNGEQQKASNMAQSGLQALQELQNLIPDKKVGLWQSLNPFGTYATQRRGVVDAISRIKTGAAMTPSEETFYNNMIPGSFDSTDVVTKKNEQLAVFLSGIAGNTIVLQSPEGDIYSYDDLMNPDQRKETRDALEQGWTLVDY